MHINIEWKEKNFNVNLHTFCQFPRQKERANKQVVEPCVGFPCFSKHRD